MTEDRFERLSKKAEAFVKKYDPGRVADYVKKWCRPQADILIRQAERLLRQVFVFEDKWDMEPCKTEYSLPVMAWDQNPSDDAEWIYMLNRHDYLFKLLVAYWLTGDRKYTDKLSDYLFDWIEKNPESGWGGETTRTIDTGIRCMNWCRILIFMIGEGLVTENETKQLLDSIGRQFTYLRERYIGKYVLSNWGVLQTTAVCEGYLWYLEYLPHSENAAWAWKELYRQLELQIMRDGSHWEQSVMYHVEVLNALTKLWADCSLSGYSVDQRLTDTIRSMSRYVLFSAAPDHCQIAQCDSDATDVRDVLTRSAVVLREPSFRFGGYVSMDFDSAWILGADGTEVYDKIAFSVPEDLCASFEDTGNIYLRSGWGENASYTYLKNGPLGSSHGHVDLTHVSLYCRGAAFLVDSGRYSYAEEEPVREQLKSAAAHNVCVIDGDPHGKPLGSWGYTSYGTCLKNYFSEEDPVRYVEMPYYGRLVSGAWYLVIRKVVVIDPCIWLVTDEICCDGKHRVETYYHLDPRVRVKREKEGKNWRLLNGGVELIIGTDEGSYRAEACLIAPCYNQLSESIKFIKSADFTGRYVGNTFFTNGVKEVKRVPVYRSGSDIPESSDLVTAIEFVRSPKESWVAVIWRQEVYTGTKVFICKGEPLYGKTVVLRFYENCCRRYRVKN